jgi:hypothetical protein
VGLTRTALSKEVGTGGYRENQKRKMKKRFEIPQTENDGEEGEE